VRGIREVSPEEKKREGFAEEVGFKPGMKE